jgi:hypothetical protein
MRDPGVWGEGIFRLVRDGFVAFAGVFRMAGASPESVGSIRELELALEKGFRFH